MCIIMSEVFFLLLPVAHNITTTVQQEEMSSKSNFMWDTFFKRASTDLHIIFTHIQISMGFTSFNLTWFSECFGRLLQGFQ